MVVEIFPLSSETTAIDICSDRKLCELEYPVNGVLMIEDLSKLFSIVWTIV